MKKEPSYKEYRNPDQLDYYKMHAQDTTTGMNNHISTNLTRKNVNIVNCPMQYMYPLRYLKLPVYPKPGQIFHISTQSLKQFRGGEFLLTLLPSSNYKIK